MIKTARQIPFMTLLLGAVMFFAFTFASAEVYATDVTMDENTTQLLDGYCYYVSGETTIDDRIEVAAGAQVKMFFRNNSELIAKQGIGVPAGSTLTIDGTGTLTATGPYNTSAIGGDRRADGAVDGGNITIQGKVNVNATGGKNAAGIGSSYNCDYSGTVQIFGGRVNATSGIDAAAIGSGACGTCSADITVTGGTVTATAKGNTTKSKAHTTSTSGAGIGAGVEGDLKSKITSSGGEVTATAGPSAAGIGVGEQGNAIEARIEIRGGRVNAYGSVNAAGIGGGQEYVGAGGEGANVYITGGTVVVSSKLRAIGPGGNDSVTGELEIADNMRVQAGNDGVRYEKTCQAADRVSDCRKYKCVRIDECIHLDSAYRRDETGHELSCPYCLTPSAKEEHDFMEVDGTAVPEGTCIQRSKTADRICKVCGYKMPGQEGELGDHNWGEVTYTWDDNNSQVTARRECRRDIYHAEGEIVKTTSEVKAATCEDPEETTYTAVFTHPSFEKQTKTVETGDALGHQWIINDETDVDGWKVTTEATLEAPGEAVRTCQRDPNHKETKVIPQLHVHDISLVKAAAPTCEVSGNKAYYECSICHALFEDAAGKTSVSSGEVIIPAKGHKAGEPIKGTVSPADCCYVGGYNLTTKCKDCGKVLKTEHIVFPKDPDTHDWDEWVTVRPATLTTYGAESRVCKNDPSHTELRMVPKLADINDAEVGLAAAGLTYNGKSCKPVVTTIGGQAVKEGTDFTAEWPDAKAVGTYTVTITGAGHYTGTTQATFQVNPKGTTLKKPKAAKKAATIKWKKQSAKMTKSRINGYQILLATNSKFTAGKKTVNVKGFNKSSKKVTKLKAGKKYYIKIRTYMTVGGKTYWSPWSKAKTAKVKK